MEMNADKPLNSTGLDQQVLVEQIRIMYRTLLPIVMVNFVVSAAVVYGLWDVVPQDYLRNWLGLMILVFCIRIVNLIYYKKNFTEQAVRRYAIFFVAGSGVTGLLWGISGVVLFPEHDKVYQLFLLFVLAGMGAGALSSLTTYLPAFFVYFPVSMLPIFFKLLSIGEQIHLSLAVMTLAYIIALSYFAININRALRQSLQLRFENLDLVEQLRQQKDEAEHASQAKSKFLAAASHDLRQPLHALTLFISVLDESIQYPKVRRVVNQIKASVLALQNLFNALLDISRLEAGVMNPDKTDFALQPLFRKLANDFNPQAAEKELHIEWPTDQFYVHTDPSLLEQILRNYLANAIRYTERGKVSITCEAQGEHVIINVSDTGSGIPEEEREAIFEEFHQLNNPERDRSKGLGLGLAIVQRTARLLEHPIAVNSRLGQGSTFSIKVNRVEPPHNIVERETRIAHTSQSLEKVLVIVIDDEASVREGTQTLLETWGCEVICAVDQREVFAQLTDETRIPDAIIADYRLRENQTGIEAIRAIHTRYGYPVPALIVTGDIAVDRLREVNNSGFQVLHKPVSPVKLRTFLRNVQRQKNLNLSRETFDNAPLT